MNPYDSSAMHQHAQLLFDAWPEAGLPHLHSWLSRAHIDANVAPHGYIRHLIAEQAAGGDELAVAALGSEADPVHVTSEED